MMGSMANDVVIAKKNVHENRGESRAKRQDGTRSIVMETVHKTAYRVGMTYVYESYDSWSATTGSLA